MSVLAATPIGGSGAAPNVVRLTPEDLLRLPDDGRLYELVDGQLVEKEMSDLAHIVVENLKDQLVLWHTRTGAGRSFVDGNFRCFPQDTGMVRRPEVAFVSRERLTGYQWGASYLTVAPDLVAEVVSPNDEVYDLDRKIEDYFHANVRRVWVINPDRKIVRVHRTVGDSFGVMGNDELTDEEILPGFRCPLSVLFALPGAAEAATAAPPRAAGA